MKAHRAFLFLVGDRDRCTYEQRLFNAFCLFSSFFFLLASVFNSIQGLGIFMIVANLAACVDLFLGYALSRIARVYNGLTISFITLSVYALLLVQYFQAAGSNGGVTYTVYVALVFGAIIFPRKLKTPFIVFMFLNVLVFFLIEMLHPNAVASYYHSGTDRFSDVLFDIFVSFSAITVLLTSYSRNYDDTYYNLEKEKAKSERLLENTLPKQVIAELKASGTTQPRLFEQVTVLFSDIVDFTRSSAGIDPATLISELNDIYTAFDLIAQSNKCERIKTIGDAYLCVCGLPESDTDHANRIANTALQMLEYMQKRNTDSPVQWRIRIGVHSGSVVGGIVGTKKYIYDIFGDTVNTASRMEHISEPMRINVTENTFELIHNDFCLTDRGSLEVKGKGETKMYFLDSVRPNGHHHEPPLAT